MATESPMRIMPGGSLINSHGRGSGASSPALEANDIRLLRERARYDNLSNGTDMLMQRSESAPPSVEGSLAALSGLLEQNRFSRGGVPDNSDVYESEEQQRSDPAYIAYYYANINLNPRLPPPLLSSENWRLAQRLQSGVAGGGNKDKWKLRSFDDNNSRSLFSSQLLTPEDLQVPEQDQLDDDHLGPMAHGFGSRARSVVDLIQQDFPRTPSPVYNLHHEAKDDSVDMQLIHLQELAALGSSSASAQLDAPVPEHAGRRSPFQVPPPPIRSASTEPIVSAQGGSFVDALKNSGSQPADLSAALKGLSMSETNHLESRQTVREDRDHHSQLRYRQQQQRQQQQRQRALLEDQMQYALQNEAVAQPPPVQPGGSNPIYAAAMTAAAAYIAAGGTPFPQQMYGPQYNLGAYPPVVGGYFPSASYDHAAAAKARAAFERQLLYQQADGPATATSPLQDALYLQYLQREIAMRNYSQSDPADLAYLAEQKLQYPRAYKANPLYYGGRSPAVPPYYNAALHRESVASLRSGLVYGWQRGSDGGDDLRGSVLLEEFKSSKSRRFELSDIAGHVVEFSADQHGSRFIQQKLETASTEEKAMVFDEVLPSAFTLMTDVFGNYVIQKFFEHGNSQQRRELAKLLVGHMLELSLQMYGCRVIQKALEVCDLDQQTLLVQELDGHVMRCVRDQNGNHVIQKCIECVPPDKIQFIISSFYGQVLTLSTHPYGCRVIQRVLEHCTDDQKQAGIMKEILGATCSLAQDQYGNYVIQHVLEHGKPHERSEIITKLAGQIVQMSQHKFASNVVEKCLEFGGPAERQILVDEMLGTTDENAPLQAMMKDQFANYVVQKVLETCNDQQREMLLGRIKVHLHALKKYIYGKHIVARLEKMVAGERRGAPPPVAASSVSSA